MLPRHSNGELVKRARKVSKKRCKPIAVDLFSGCGGLTLGLKKAGFRVAGAVEFSPVAAQTYLANHPEVVLEVIDIQELAVSTFRKKLGLRRGELDLLAGCPPCQGFSTLRTRNGATQNRDRRNKLLSDMLRFIEEFRPKAVMMENVPRLLRHRSFRDFCSSLRKMGYQLNYDIKNASQYGVPQRRQRLIVLAGKGFEINFGAEARDLSSVRGAIGHLPRPKTSKDPLHNFPEKRRSERVQKLIRDIPKNGGSRNDLPRRRQLECHVRSNGFSDVYGRMAWDSVAPTITSGCSNPSKGRFLHPSQNRPITLREAALLQSFPETYRFELSAGKEEIALMIGNALPPEFIRRHAKAVYSSLRQNT